MIHWRHNIALPGHAERGSITIFFILFLPVLLGVLAYSYFVGKSVDQKIRLENAADASAYSMATHAATGLNMIAINNLAIATSLHVAAATPVYSRFHAIGVAADLTREDYQKLTELKTQPDDSDFAKTYETTAAMGGRFMQTAQGLTALNKAIARYWLMGALAKGVEQYRANAPGAVGMPMQASRPLSIENSLGFFQFRYEHLAITSEKAAMCHAINSSKNLPNRHYASRWIESPKHSVGLDTSLLSTTGETAARGAITAANIALGGAKVAVLGIAASEGCFSPAVVNPNCWKLFYIAKQLSARLPLPQFGESTFGDLGVGVSFSNCGLNDEGDFGRQIEAFKQAVATTEDDQIGLIYADLPSPAAADEFQKSLQFASLVGQPQLTSEELNYLQNHLPGAAPGNPTVQDQCPPEWQFDVNNHQFCAVALDGFDQNFLGLKKMEKSGPGSDVDLISGGVQATVRSAQGQDVVAPGRLREVWKRVQWAVGQAGVRFRPADGDPNPQQRMQLFWPAWKAEMMPVTVTANIEQFMGVR